MMAQGREQTFLSPGHMSTRKLLPPAKNSHLYRQRKTALKGGSVDDSRIQCQYRAIIKPSSTYSDYKPFGFPFNTFLIVCLSLSPAMGLNAST